MRRRVERRTVCGVPGASVGPRLGTDSSCPGLSNPWIWLSAVQSVTFEAKRVVPTSGDAFAFRNRTTQWTGIIGVAHSRLWGFSGFEYPMKRWHPGHKRSPGRTKFITR